MSSTCEPEPSGKTDSNEAALKPKEDKTDSTPLVRFAIEPIKVKKPAVLAPELRPAPILIVERRGLFTDQQMIAILTVLLVAVCFIVIFHAARS